MTMTGFVNQIDFTIPAEDFESVRASIRYVARPDISVGAGEARGLVAASEQQFILDRLAEIEWLPVGINGMQGTYTPGDRIGSWRASLWTPQYAQVLWQRVAPLLPVETFHTTYPTDHDGGQWTPVGISPLLRFIRYTNDGALVEHYDAPFITDENTRTLKSVVLYLHHDATLTGGQTRFLTDPQAGLPVSQMDFADGAVLSADAGPERVRVAVDPTPGTGLIFPHRIRHDSAPTAGSGEKIIVRTDLIYARA
jgi:hypothetical protein